MQDRVFIDSNIWVYFFLESPIFEEEEKYRRAFALISLLDKILASTQVLNETASNCRFIYSEDLQHRITVENQLVIQNPFVL
jgi:predicted nucleic acid-binding protein